MSLIQPQSLLQYVTEVSKGSQHRDSLKDEV